MPALRPAVSEAETLGRHLPEPDEAEATEKAWALSIAE